MQHVDFQAIIEELLNDLHMGRVKIIDSSLSHVAIQTKSKRDNTGR